MGVGGGLLINVFLRVYFDVFRQSSPFNFRQSKHSSFYVFGVFVDSSGGTPYKRIHERLFLRFWTKFAFQFFPKKTGFIIYVFAVFVEGIGGQSF